MANLSISFANQYMQIVSNKIVLLKWRCTFCWNLLTAALETYHVYVMTGNVSGSGTDANVYLTLFGEKDDTGTCLIMFS